MINLITYYYVGEEALPPGWTKAMVRQKIQEVLPSQTEVKEAESAISQSPSKENPEKISVLDASYSRDTVAQEEAGKPVNLNLERITPRKTGEIMTRQDGDMLRAQQKAFHQAFVEYAKESPVEAGEKARDILKSYDDDKIDRNLGKGRQEVADCVLKEELARWAKEFEANNPEKVAQYKKELEAEYQEWAKESKIAYSNATVEQFNKAHDKLQAIETKMLSKRKTGELMTFAEGEELRIHQKLFYQAFVEYAKDSPLEAAERAEHILKEEKIDRNLGKGRKQAAGYALKVSMNTLKETHQWDAFVKENALRAKQWQELSRSMRALEKGLSLER